MIRTIKTRTMTEEQDEQYIDHEYTNEVVCPHCGCEFSDSWDLDDSGELECECYNTFRFQRDVDVTYITSKIEPPKQNKI